MHDHPDNMEYSRQEKITYDEYKEALGKYVSFLKQKENFSELTKVMITPSYSTSQLRPKELQTKFTLFRMGKSNG